MLNLSTKFAGTKVLITGGTGFLGKHLVPYLNQLGASRVMTAPRTEFNLLDWSQTQQLFQSDKYDYVIHAAAVQGAGDWPLRHTADQIYANSLINMHVLEAWRLHQPSARLVNCGSSCSYPGNLRVLREQDYLQGPVHPSVQYYGLSKILMQQGLEAYKEQHSNLRGTTAVFATLYGPHDSLGERAHVVTALIDKFLKAKRARLPVVEVWGDGTQTRELIYVKYQIVGLLTVADYDGPLINLGTGVEISIHELAELICQLVGYEGSIEYNTNRFVGVRHKVLDISLAKQLFGWTTEIPITPLADGLQQTLEGYQSP